MTISLTFVKELNFYVFDSHVEGDLRAYGLLDHEVWFVKNIDLKLGAGSTVLPD